MSKKQEGIRVDWTESHLKVWFADMPEHPILDGPLRFPIRVPPKSSGGWSDCETRWYVEDEGTVFVVQLEKADRKEKWSRIFASEHYVKLAEAGSVAEQINLALQLEQKDPEASFKWWLRAADEGENSQAELSVAKKYRDGTGVARDEAKSQEYFVKAALNANPQPLALLQVGVWAKKGELLDYGKTAMLGRSHRDVWDLCFKKFPTQQIGEQCAKLLIAEYLEQGDMDRAEEYAKAIGQRLERSQGTPSSNQKSFTRSTEARRTLTSAAGPARNSEAVLTTWKKITAVAALFATVAVLGSKLLD